jgi:hypothetical protein
MSRYDLTALPRYPKHTVRIGWDKPLQTYFVQVLDPDAEECNDDTPAQPEGDNPSIWLGCDFGEITDAAAAIEIVRPYAEIPAGLLAHLKADQAGEPGRGEQVWQLCNRDEYGNHL